VDSLAETELRSRQSRRRCQLADTSIACGLSSIHVSIDGAGRVTYEYIRPRANLPKVLRNLRRLMLTRRLLDSHTPHVRIVLVLMRRDR